MGVWKKQKTFRITRDLMRLLQKEHLLIFQSTLPDPRSRAPVTAIARFQSTLPERGETLLPFSPARRGEVFQSTLPAWGETPATGERSKGRKHFNPLSPHGERHLRRGKYPSPLFISIHSPRMGRDNFGQNSPATRKRFQSTLPAWGETHAWHAMAKDLRYFNPLSPHGERQS